MSKPMNPNDLLTASDADLPKMLGEVLQVKHSYEHSKSPLDSSMWCRQCNGTKPKRGENKTQKLFNVKSEYCSIPLNWDNAMKWRDWAVEEYGQVTYSKAFEAYFKRRRANGIYNVYSFSEPKDYLIPAADCKLNQKKAR